MPCYFTVQSRHTFIKFNRLILLGEMAPCRVQSFYLLPRYSQCKKDSKSLERHAFSVAPATGSDDPFCLKNALLTEQRSVHSAVPVFAWHQLS